MVSNVDRILERAGAATAASAVPVSGGTGKNRANQNRVRDILTRAGAKPVEPEWQAAMFGGTPRWTLTDERLRGIIDVDQTTGNVSWNKNAASKAMEQKTYYENLLAAADTADKKREYREAANIYKRVLDELGVDPATETYKSLMNNSDYAQNSQAGNVGAFAFRNKYINDINSFRENAQNWADAFDKASSSMVTAGSPMMTAAVEGMQKIGLLPETNLFEKYNKMTKEEQGIYNYLYNTQGKKEANSIQ